MEIRCLSFPARDRAIGVMQHRHGLCIVRRRSARFRALRLPPVEVRVLTECGRFFGSGPRALLSLHAGVQGDHGGARGTCTARDGVRGDRPAEIISPVCTAFQGPLRQKQVASALPLSSFQQVLVRLRPRAMKVRGAAILSASPSRSPNYRRAGFARGSTPVLFGVPWCGTMHIYSAPPHLALTTLPVAPFRREKRSRRDPDMRDRGRRFRRMILPRTPVNRA